MTRPQRLRQIAAALLDGADDMDAHADDGAYNLEAVQDRLYALAVEASEILLEMERDADDHTG